MKAQINTELIHEGCINDLCYSSKGKYVEFIILFFFFFFFNIKIKDGLLIL